MPVDDAIPGPRTPAEEEAHQAAVILLKLAVAKCIDVAGPVATGQLLAMAFAGHIAGGGTDFAMYQLHMAHVMVHNVLSKTPSPIIQLS